MTVDQTEDRTGLPEVRERRGGGTQDESSAAGLEVAVETIVDGLGRSGAQGLQVAARLANG